MTATTLVGFRVWRGIGDGKLYSTSTKWPWMFVDPGPCAHITGHWEGGVESVRPGECQGFPTCRECGYYSYSTWEACQASTYGAGKSRCYGVVEISGIVRWAKVRDSASNYPAPCGSNKRLSKPALRFRSERVRIVGLLPGAWDTDVYKGVRTMNDDEIKLLEMAGYTQPPSDSDDSGSGVY